MNPNDNNLRNSFGVTALACPVIPRTPTQVVPPCSGVLHKTPQPNTRPSSETLDQLMRRLEEQGTQRTAQLMSSAFSATQPKTNTNNTPEKTLGSIINTVKHIPQESILSIMKEGDDEFVKQTGRHMTYGEMRQLYG